MPTHALAQPDGEKALYLVVRYSAVGLPLIVLAGFQAGGWATYAGFFLVFVFYFLVELILHCVGYGTTTTQNDEFRFTSKDRAGHEQACLLFFSVAQLVVIPLILLQIPGRGLEPFEILGTILSMGVMAGSVGGLASHEFIHRSTRWERTLGTMLLASFNYAHFKVSHLGGHHRNVGLHHDWSTARLGESSYAFLARAVGMGLAGAFQLEAQRLARAGLGPYSLRNFVVRYALFQLLLWSAVAHLGTTALVIMLGYSTLAICFAEMVNYLSHYGLTRNRRADGSHEPFQDRHTWESNNKVTNWFIFNAGKHVHHHRNPGATHDELKLAHDKPYLPHGLPLMTLIAFIPPLYFRVMDRMLKATAAPTLAR